MSIVSLEMKIALVRTLNNECLKFMPRVCPGTCPNTGTVSTRASFPISCAGQVGDDGFRGVPGRDGLRGESGEAGKIVDATPGAPGLFGDKGYPGRDGYPGLKVRHYRYLGSRRFRLIGEQTK